MILPHYDYELQFSRTPSLQYAWLYEITNLALNKHISSSSFFFLSRTIYSMGYRYRYTQYRRTEVTYQCCPGWRTDNKYASSCTERKEILWGVNY